MSVHLGQKTPNSCPLSNLVPKDITYYNQEDLDRKPPIPHQDSFFSPPPHPSRLTTTGVPPLRLMIQVSSSSPSLTSWCSAHAGMLRQQLSVFASGMGGSFGKGRAEGCSYSAKSPGERCCRLVPFSETIVPCPDWAKTIVSCSG